MTKLVKIGKSQVLATPLGFGANSVGGDNLFPNLNDQLGIQTVQTAINNGINLIDTAYAYGYGKSETLIGEAIKPFDRDKLIIATKGAQTLHNGKVSISNDPDFLKQCVYDSLKRLQTDYLDIFYIHFPDEDTPKDVAVAALQELKDQGIIKAIGVSNFSYEQLVEANQNGQIDVVEDNYSLIYRKPETQIFPYLNAHNIAFVPYFPLASGLLTGKYSHPIEFPEGDLRKNDKNFNGENFKAIVTATNSLKPIAKNHDISITELVLAWYIKNPNITVVIPGAKTPEQAKTNARSMNVAITNSEYNIIDNTFKSFL